jgi:hypothetical protein
MKTRSLALAALSCLYLTTPLSATNYYVDPNGNDLNPGTASQPWKTVARVNAGPLLRGDTVYFARGGTWRETLAIPAAGNSANRITFDAHGTGANPVISGAEVVTGWTTYGAGSPNTYSAPLAASTAMVTANSAYLKKGTSSTTLGPNQYFWAAGTLYINIGADPTGAVIEAGQRDHAVTTVAGRHYITLRNLRLEKTNISNLLIVQSNFWRVEDCELFFGNSTENQKTGAGVQADRANDSVFTRLHINYALGDGLMLWRSARVEVSHCNIHNVLDDGADGIQIGAPSTSPNACDGFKVLNNYVERPSAFVIKGGIITARGDNGIISGNVVVGGKFGLSSNGNNNIIEYNRVSSFGDNGGIRVSIGVPLNGTKIRYNVVTNNGNPSQMDEAGICLLHDSNENNGIPAPRTNFSIENNVIYNTYYGISISQEFSGTIRNNIVWNDLPTATNRRLTVFKFSATGTTVIDNNIWQQRGTNPMFRIGNSQASDGEDFNYPTLASWQAATPYDDNSTSASPQWVDPANYDFHLQEGSPAIDGGVGIGVAADFEGNAVPQGGAPDIGAFEFRGIRIYEGFDYAAGTVNGANGGTGWAGPWAASGGAGLNHVIAGGFSYLGLPAVGNRLQMCDSDNVWQQVSRPLSKTFGATTGTYWISFLAKKNSSVREAYIDFGGLSFRAALGSPWDVKTPGTSYTTLNATFADQHLFLVKVDAAAGSATVRVWVDPVVATGEPHPASALVTLNDPAGFTFNTVAIRHGLGGNSKQSGEWDEIRLGSSFGAVTTAP